MARKTKSSKDTRSIDLDDEYSTDFWTQELNVTITKLKAAVDSVGKSAIAVRRALKKS